MKKYWQEIKYDEETWDELFPIAKYKGGSLHCDEWLVDYQGARYRLTNCSSGDEITRCIEKEYNVNWSEQVYFLEEIKL